MSHHHCLPRCVLALETGEVFYGHSFGVPGTSFGELIFNTSMSGYQEILTDPSYRRQIITMTYPEIGNYGTHPDESESDHIHASGLVVKNHYEDPGGHLGRLQRKSLKSFLQEHGTVAISGVDTRKITRILRNLGCVKSVISTEISTPDQLVEMAKKSQPIGAFDCVKEVTTLTPYDFEPTTTHSSSHQDGKDQRLERVVVLDYGVKRSILKNLIKGFKQVTVVPAYSTFQEILALTPEGILLSNGPGDPDTFQQDGIDTVKQLIGKIPLFGICFGHQILSKALGFKTYKLKFGHHASNHPVKNLATGKISITSQNHGYSIQKNPQETTYLTNLNDQTIAGYKDETKQCFSVQYHPEAGPGPQDSLPIFEQFFQLAKRFNQIHA